MSYIKYSEIASRLNIKKGDILHLSSDISALAINGLRNGENFDANVFIDSFMDIIGSNGTLIFPTYTWDFCSGKTFDYRSAPCKTGVLAAATLKRKDFKRTRHPLYSFTVWGRDQELLVGMENKSSFGADSPFGYMYRNKAKNLLIGVDLNIGYTFIHFVEEQVGGLSYRYQKDFLARYIDENGVESSRTYSMLVRDLDMDVVIKFNPFEELFIKAGVLDYRKINSVDF